MKKRRKKPFRTKLLSALLVASMLIGTGSSVFAAPEETAQVTQEKEASSDESAKETENTVKTPEKDEEGKTEEVSLSNEGETMEQPEEAETPVQPGVAESEQNPPQTPEDGSLETEEGTENGEEIQILPSGDGSAEDIPGGEIPEEVEEPEYASVEEFLAAVAAVGEVDEVEDMLAAIDNCLSIYARLSPEDQEAQKEAYDYIVGYREQLAAGNPDLGIEQLALISGEEFTVNVVKVVNGNAVETKTLRSKCLQSTGHSGFNHSTNLYALANQSGFYGYKGYNWSKFTTVPSNYTKGSAPNNRYSGVHYNITGSAPYRADETLFLFFEENKTFTLNYDANGGTGEPGPQTNTSTGTSCKFTISQTTPTRDGYTFKGWAKTATGSVAYQPGQSINVTDVTTTLYAVWEETKPKYYAILKYNRSSKVMQNAGYEYEDIKNWPSDADLVGESTTITTNVTTVIPALDGYIFKGWATTKDGVVEYQPGEAISLPAGTTAIITRLYPVWEKETDPDDETSKVDITVRYIYEAEDGTETELRKDYIETLNKNDDYDVSGQVPETITKDGRTYKKDTVDGDLTGTAEADKTITVKYVTENGETPKDPDETPKDPDETPKDPDETPKDPDETPKDPDETPKDPDETPKDPDETPTDPVNPPGGGGGGGNDDDDDDDDDPDPTPTPGPTPPTPGPTPPTPGPTPPTPGPTPVPTTPVVTSSVAPTPTADVNPPAAETEALDEEAVPLANGRGTEEEKLPEIKGLEEEEVPLAAGGGLSWALINFALMNLAIFESVMLLVGYFVKTKNDEEEEKRKLKKKGIFRVISLPIAIISLIAFILTEDISLPTALVDKYTIIMLIIAIVQTVMVALSNKKYEDEEA